VRDDQIVLGLVNIRCRETLRGNVTGLLMRDTSHGYTQIKTDNINAEAKSSVSICGGILLSFFEMDPNR
jgi:hypothetical protein